MTENMFDLSIEAENRLMSILIKYPDKFHELTSLKVFMLSSQANQKIFNAIKDYQAQNLLPTYEVLLGYPDYFTERKKEIDRKMERCKEKGKRESERQ